MIWIDYRNNDIKFKENLKPENILRIRLSDIILKPNFYRIYLNIVCKNN